MNVHCSSCHDDLKSLCKDLHVYVTHCGHICCSNCRTNWFGVQNTCPRCRSPQTQTNLIRLYYDLSEPDTMESLPYFSQRTAVEDGRDAIDQASVQFHEGLSKHDDYLALSNSTNEFIETISSSTHAYSVRKPLKLLGLALRELSTKFQTLQKDCERLNSAIQATKAQSRSKLSALREEIKLQNELINRREREMEGHETRWKLQTSNLFSELNEARTRIETQAAELIVKSGEASKLQNNNLEWKKKYHALKQKVSQAKQRKKSPVEDSLVII